MKSDPRRFAPIGLVLSGLAFLTIVGVLIVRAFVAVDLYTPPDAELLNRILIIGVAVFIVGFAVYALLDPERVRRFLTGRQVQYGSNSFVLFIAFIGILIVANLLVQQYSKSWDVTEDKQHTLAPETIQALQTLPESVSATAFYSSRLNKDTVNQLLEDFKTNSDGKFDYQFMDPDSNPVLLNQFGITGDGKILLQMGEHHEIVSFASESELTNGLIRLLNPDTPVLYFLTGDGEHDIENSGEGSYTRVRQVLESKNYKVNTLNLQAQAIPEDARAIVIAGPLVPLTDNSMKLLQEFVEGGGSLLVMENPAPLTDFGDQPDPLADYLASDWGITLNNDIVVDTNSPSSPFFAVGAQYISHPITEKMQGIGAIFPYSRSITVDTENTDVSPTELVLTIEQSWGETNFEAIQQQQDLVFDEDVDTFGPMTLAAAAEDATTGSRVVVFGSSVFAEDDNFDFSGNGDMVINSVDWLAEQEDLINLTTNAPQERTFTPPGSLQFILSVVSAVCIIPLAIVAAGVYAWIMRRRRG
jgi:ABC-type uncharacterized transport system involved in gliding motility auxiliary subunit